ncbi:inosine monophosphate dehydrogenase [Piedraia hortae CBS 480.64]|uniref:Inosine monophosphate dehydrogenase n=1 Tax=Piedraia hortae CBS 480.64 TaxID=1314780 RepID=A0A6A7C9E4_9PEZI|nr:inosine monophosphate dehydrogenase [Piedraia hortae CBS 480.64]
MHSKSSYPWTKQPVIASAPMRLIALSDLAASVSMAGGIGFIGAGSDVSNLDSELTRVRQLIDNVPGLHSSQDVLPVGVGFLLWAGEELLNVSLPILAKHKPAAVWLFAPRQSDDLVCWTKGVRGVSPATSVWIQVGTVSDAVEAVKSCSPEVLVVQGTDAGGHGLERCASLMPLFPEVDDAISLLCKDASVDKPIMLAAGGIADGRGVAAAMALGADGVVMGTRYLASKEAIISQGYQTAVLKAADGGSTTLRGKLYDTLRGTTDWPLRYGGRGVLNDSHFDAEKGMGIEENKKKYDEAVEAGDWGRLTTYAGTAVGLVKEVLPAAGITETVRLEAQECLRRTSGKL